MSDSIYHGGSEPATETAPETTQKNPHRGSEVDIPVPYTDYTEKNPYPYLVEYFKLGDTWSEAQGGFTDEIGRLDEYITEKVKSGEIPNSITGVRDHIKSLEKMTNMSKEERAVIKVETLAAYTDFLMKTDGIKSNIRRYNGTG